MGGKTYAVKIQKNPFWRRLQSKSVASGGMEEENTHKKKKTKK